MLLKHGLMAHKFNKDRAGGFRRIFILQSSNGSLLSSLLIKFFKFACHSFILELK